MTSAPRISLAIAALAVLTATPSLHSEADAIRQEPVVQRYLDHGSSQPVTSYRAFRRLEAEGLGRAGWLEAWTEVDHDTFRYEITAEGGSESVLDHVLRKYLQNEGQALATGEARRSTLTPDNYVFVPADQQVEGLVKILMKPRRKGKLMLDGAMFFAPEAADLVRVEARVVSNPSFWVKRVDITKHFQRINGLCVPVNVDSTANIRFAGKANFRMSYRYTELNGVPTPASGVLASSGTR